MAGRILITGAPGNVGSAVVQALQGVTTFRVGAYNIQNARDLFGDTTDIVPFDFLAPATFGPAFSGIERMFLLRPPRITNAKRDIAPAIQAALTAGVRHFVFLSIQGVEKQRFLPHHKIEQMIQQTGAAHTFLRAGFFMQNLSTTHRAQIRDHGEIGLPVGKSKTSFIDVRDIGAVAARTLTETGHEGKTYTLTGSEALDYFQVAKIMSAELGRTIRYTNPSIPRFIWQQRRLGSSWGFALIMTFLYTVTRLGMAKGTTTDVETILGRSPISFAQYVHDHRDLWDPQISE